MAISNKAPQMHIGQPITDTLWNDSLAVASFIPKCFVLLPQRPYGRMQMLKTQVMHTDTVKIKVYNESSEVWQVKLRDKSES